MTDKITMPDPVASVLVGNITEYEHISVSGLRRGKTHLLITTTQAEAYANARVKEKMEELANEIAQYHPKASPRGIAASIRALIPKESE